MVNLKFIKSDDKLFCSYTSEPGYIRKLIEDIDNYGEATIKRVFKIKKKNLVFNHESRIGVEDETLELLLEKENNDNINFTIGSLVDDYYLLDSEILEFNNKFFIHKDVKIDHKIFLANRNINILSRIDNIIATDVFIGESNSNVLGGNVIPESEFFKLLKSFPNTTELDKYAGKRIELIIGEYIGLKQDYIGEYEKYMSTKLSEKKSEKEKIIENNIFENEFNKFMYIKNKLEHMLSNENKYTEKEWQKEIAQIMTLIFSKYSYITDETTFKTNEGDKRIDFIFVDFQGNIDVVEIKKSHGIDILSKAAKKANRNNYVPSKQLISAVMQTEKYLYHLNRNAEKSELKIKDKFLKDHGTELPIKIRNPQGIIILGRSNNMNLEQLSDYEIIKRQYKHIAEIISYDDLVNRLERLLKHFETKT